MTDRKDDRDQAREERVGSLAEEAAKLFEVLKGASHEHVTGAGGMADAAGALWQDLNDHMAGENCRYCPVCQLIGVLREPEVRRHLTSAAGSLAAALASALATRIPEQQPPESGAQPSQGEEV
jgi:hypothetical protein